MVFTRSSMRIVQRCDVIREKKIKRQYDEKKLRYVIVLI